MPDFSSMICDGLTDGILLGIKSLWDALTSSPALVALYAFLVIGSIILCGMNKKKKRH